MLTDLHEAQLESIRGTYRARGYYLFKQAFSMDAVRAIDDWLAEASSTAGDRPTLEPQFEEAESPGPRAVRKLRRLFWNDPAFWERLFERQGLFDLARRIVSPSPALVFHAAFLKPAGVGSPVAYHQDQALWTYDYPNAANLWLAVTPSRIDNGCIRLCPGSHLRGVIPHKPLPDYAYHEGIDLAAADLESVPIEMDCGDLLLWDRFTAHGSEANRSGTPRRGVVMVFADAAQPGFRATDALAVPEATQTRSC